MPSSPTALAARPHLFEVERPTGSLPRYLFRRGDTLYFKRKIPADVAHGFADVKGQIWKSLGTSLVEKAKVTDGAPIETPNDASATLATKLIAATARSAFTRPARG